MGEPQDPRQQSSFGSFLGNFIVDRVVSAEIGSGVVNPAVYSFPAQAVALDHDSLRIARTAAQSPWFARGVTGLVLIAAPVLWTFDAAYTGQGPFSSTSVDVITWMFGICVLPFWLLPWFIAFLAYRSRARYLRWAIGARRAWLIQGPVQQTDRKTVVVAGRSFRTVRALSIPAWANGQTCNVVFADANVQAPVDFSWSQAMVIRIDAPDGRRIYPDPAAVPDLFRAPALIASGLVGLAFTAACTAQAQGYSDAAARLRDIRAAVPCTAASQPGDDCSKWVPGTLRWGGSYSESPDSSKCPVTLHWAGGSRDGEVRADNAHCSTQFSSTEAMPVTIELVKNFPVQVRVGDTVYLTDQWPPNGDAVFVFEWIARVAALLWLAWPIVQLGAAVLYRVRR